jgi:DNA modification methylase
MALKLGRKAIGIELKPEYFKIAVGNMKYAESLSNVKDMFSQSGVTVNA